MRRSRQSADIRSTRAREAKAMLMRTGEPERTVPLAGAALAIAAIGIATILGAYYFEYVLHYQPCPLCLEQRIPYYVGIPLALAVALAARFRTPRPALATRIRLQYSL